MIFVLYLQKKKSGFYSKNLKNLLFISKTNNIFISRLSYKNLKIKYLYFTHLKNNKRYYSYDVRHY